MSEAGPAIRDAMDPKNFPRWAQACPKSFGALQNAIAKAGVLLGEMPLISKHDKANLTQIMAHVAATCWAAGAASVQESNGASLPDGPKVIDVISGEK